MAGKTSPLVSKLLACKDLDSPVGDLARDACVDKRFPRGASTAAEILAYLQLQNACPEALDAFRDFCFHARIVE